MSFLNDYVDAKERLDMFYAAFPDGSIQFEFKGVMPGNDLMIWGVAYAYRTPDDPRPGMGTAAELITGKTTYTRFSELMNLETSAWARAIASLGIGLRKGVASADEVKYAQDRQVKSIGELVEALDNAPDPNAMTEKQFKLIKLLFAGENAEMTKYVENFKSENGLPAGEKLTIYWATKLIDELKQKGYTPRPRKNIDQEAKYE